METTRTDHAREPRRNEQRESMFSSWSSFWAGVSRGILWSLRGIARSPVRLFAPQPSRLPGALKVLIEHRPTLLASIARGALTGRATLQTIKTPANWVQVARVVLPPMAINSVAGTLLFSVYGKVLLELVRAAEASAPTVSMQELVENDKIAQQHIPFVFVAGGIAGASTAWITTPIDQIAQHELDLRSTCIRNAKGELQKCHYDWLSAMQHLRQQSGIKAFYNGLVANTLREGLGFSLFFATYVITRRYLARVAPRETLARNQVAGIVCSGGVAGIMYNLSDLPFQWRWIRQNRPNTIRFKTLVLHQLSPFSLVRSFLPSALVLVIYEWSLRTALAEL